MVYANDLWVQLPTKDLYDSPTMQIAINAARDMYERGQETLKDFNKLYGDFYTPIIGDQSKYDEEVIQPVRNVINAIYAAGGDPLRSPEARSLISRAIYNVDPKRVALFRQRADDAKEYYKNMAALKKDNKYNEKFSMSLGEDPSQWDENTTGITSPTVYLNLKLYTENLFDDIKDSFIDKGDKRYDWYGVTENDLYKSLTPDKLGGLLDTPIGRFHYNNSVAELIAEGNTNPTELEKLERFRKDIVAANHEKIHENRKLNELYELNLKLAAQRERSAGTGATTISPQWSWMEALRRNTAAHAAGMTMLDWGYDGKKVLNSQRDAQMLFGKYVSNATNNHSGTTKGSLMFIDRYESVQYNPTELIGFLISSNYDIIDGKKVPRWEMVDNNTFRIKPQDADRILTRPYVISHTAGYRGPMSNYKHLFKDADYIDISLSGGVYGAYMKDAKNKNNFRISNITVGKVVGNKKDEDGKEILDSRGMPILDIRTRNIKGSSTMYFDSHITSEGDDPRLGYLGTVNNAGNVVETSNLPVTNTLDYRYMDAVLGDVIMSGSNITGTVYDHSATLPEVLGFGQ